jgi:hypothetical protein
MQHVFIRGRGRGVLVRAEQAVGAREFGVHALAAAAHRALAGVEQMFELRHARGAEPAQRHAFVLRIEDEQARQRHDVQLLDLRRVLRVFVIEFEPDEPSGVPREGWVREHERPHRSAAVSPWGPGFDEQRHLARTRLGDGLRVSSAMNGNTGFGVAFAIAPARRMLIAVVVEDAKSVNASTAAASVRVRTCGRGSWAHSLHATAPRGAEPHGRIYDRRVRPTGSTPLLLQRDELYTPAGHHAVGEFALHRSLSPSTKRPIVVQTSRRRRRRSISTAAHHALIFDVSWLLLHDPQRAAPARCSRRPAGGVVPGTA